MVGTPKYYLEMTDKLQKLICRILGPSFAASLELLVHRWIVASLRLFNRYCFGRFLSDLPKLLSIPYSWGGLLVILIDCMFFLSLFLDVIRIPMSTVSFLAQLDYLPIEFFPLTYDLNGFKSRINKQLISVVTFPFW